MNDKQQLAAMGEHMAEQPLCMAKRIEELEAQVRVMSELLTRCRPYIVDQAGWGRSYEKVVLLGIDEALSGKLPSQDAPEGWQLVPVEPTQEMSIAGCQVPLNKAARHNTVYRAMLAAAPKSGAKP